MESDNIYNKILELFGRIPENYSILEEQIDIKTQMAYFEKSKKLKLNRPEKSETLAKKELLYDDTIGTNEKMEILTTLANLDDVEAFRLIEKYLTLCPAELKDWVTLSLQESRMTLESSLLDENQVIISTGLGGKGKKLRYFTVLASKEGQSFSNLQKKLIEKELDFSMKKQEGEIEKIEFYDNYSTFLALVPLNVSIKELINIAIDECNQIGDFISPKFILTNVKVLSIDEIENSWNKVTDGEEN